MQFKREWEKRKEDRIAVLFSFNVRKCRNTGNRDNSRIRTNVGEDRAVLGAGSRVWNDEYPGLSW